MKKILSICMLLIIGLHMPAFAADKTDANREQTKQMLDKEIQKHVFFPVLSAATTNATVDVILRINASGNVEVVSANSTNEQIKLFVQKQLSEITLNKEIVQTGEVFHYRFSFKRQA
ncbi:MAG: hypothetical protein ACKVOK_14630 [Flavobacteriales bacterium]